MGIQINGTNDVISAADGSLTVLGTELKDLSQLNVTGVATATSLFVSGVATAASLVVSGNASIGGTITYMDVSNVDSVGIITAQQGLQVLANGLDVTGVSTFKSNVSIADSIIHTGDTDTSIRFPTAGTFTIHTQGSERLRVGGSGFIGIGTDSPQQSIHLLASNPAVRLEDIGSNSSYAQISGNGGKLYLQADDNNVQGSSAIEFHLDGDVKALINSSGDVGVGTATPRSALDLAEKTDAVALPQGTTAQRPTGDNPYLRWNTTNSALEFYNGTAWVEIISDYFPSGSTILG